ncbi:MAG: winged helix-turn-helix domain-containing protein [Holosporaceae bacterium]|jgi:hypothetical protein|nr:winged helix-turn-helix domain-containing protein [Holosporaceae bacterium]
MEIFLTSEEKYKITYRVQGMTCWLQNRRFSHKRQYLMPSKADPEKQAKFVKVKIKK